MLVVVKRDCVNYVAMIVGDRIAARLEATGLSQSELARRLRVRQSTISGLVRGEQRSSTRLHEIARELGTTPAYLLGETDDPQSEAKLPELTYEQRQLLACFEVLDPTDRQLLLAMAMRMADRGGPNRIQNPRLDYGVQPR